MTTREQDLAIRGAAQNAASHEYFSTRDMYPSTSTLPAFESGFVRGYDAATAPLMERIAELEALANSEGSRAVEYLRRARAAEAKLEQQDTQPVAMYMGHRHTPADTTEFWGFSENRMAKGTPLYTHPAPKQVPLTDAQKQRIANETGAGHSLICLVESYINSTTKKGTQWNNWR